jgi:beta-aspartyl-dipeptidase (metallo-type)
MDQLFEIIDKYNFPVEHISPTHVARTKDLFEQAIIFASKGGMIDITTGASKFTDPYKAVIHGIDSGISINSMTFSTDGHAGLSVYDKKGIQIGTKKAPIDANLKQFILLVNKGGFSIEDSLKLVTSNPARNLGLKNKGTLSIGNDADFCIVDINKPWIVKKEKMISKSKNTCIEDKKLQGKVTNTFVKGVELFKL